MTSYRWALDPEAPHQAYPALREAARDKTTYLAYIPRDLVNIVERLVSPTTITEMIQSLCLEPSRLAMLEPSVQDKISRMCVLNIYIDMWLPLIMQFNKY